MTTQAEVAERGRLRLNAIKHIRRMQEAAERNGCIDLAILIEEREDELLAVLLAPAGSSRTGPHV